MKKLAFLGLIICIILSCSFAFSDSGSTEKLKRGVKNIFTCPAEIVKGVKEAREQGAKTHSVLKSEGWDSAIIWGLPNGVLRMGTRALVGVYEVVTFPIAAPKEYKPILRDVSEEGFFE